MKPVQRQTSSERDEGLQLFAEFRTLERQRVGEGVTPLEYQRWLDLRLTLDQKHGKQVEVDGITRMRVEYRTEDHLMDSVIPELPEGGIFVGTPFAPDMGTELILVIEFGRTETFEIGGIVLSNNATDGFTTARLGMGVGFQRLDEKQRIWAERIGARKSSDAKEVE